MRQLVWCGEKLVGLLKASFTSHPFPCRRSFGVVRRAMMAIERSEFFIGYCWPLRPHLTESFHPTVAVLTFETRRLPDQKQSITWKMAFDPSHKGSFLRRAEMVERLADPDHVKWTLPSLNCLDEILTAKFDWTSKRGKGVLATSNEGLEMSMPM